MATLRSEKLVLVSSEKENCDQIEFVTPESIVAVAAAENAINTVWFIKVKLTKCCNKQPVTEHYKLAIWSHVRYITWDIS